MKVTKTLAAAVAVAVIGSSAIAGDVATKTTIKPLTVAKSTQATSLALGGLGAGGAGLLLVGGAVVIGVIAASTSGT